MKRKFQLSFCLGIAMTILLASEALAQKPGKGGGGGGTSTAYDLFRLTPPGSVAGSVEALHCNDSANVVAVSGHAQSINASGSSVGLQNVQPRRNSTLQRTAVLWPAANSVVDLNTQVSLASGERLQQAFDINTRGDILAKNNQSNPCLLIKKQLDSLTPEKVEAIANVTLASQTASQKQSSGGASSPVISADGNVMLYTQGFYLGIRQE